MDEIIDTFDQFNKTRLKPNHEVSQWYMHIEDLRKQVEYLAQNITQEKIVFLGDGDGVSIMLAIELSKIQSSVKEICVFDIDERELNLYNFLANKFNVKEKIKFSTVHYNVFDKLPENFIGYFDFFYINPPYSYTTEPVGLGFSLWLERCIELTTKLATGCIVYPVSHRPIDVTKVGEYIFNYLNENKFNIISQPEISHHYGESECISKNIIVRKSENTKSHYLQKPFPKNILKNLYHYSTNPPHLIFDDKTEFGKPTFYSE